MRMMFQTAMVLRIFDYVSGKPLQTMTMQLPQGYQYVPKGEGYFIILGKGLPAFLHIALPQYQPLHYEQTALQPHMTLWLHPKPTTQTQVLTCHVQDGMHPYAYQPSDMRLLLPKAAEDTQLSLFAERLPVLEGRKILLVNGKQMAMAHVLVQDKTLLTIDDLPEAFPKIKTQVHLLYTGQAQADGTVHIAVPSAASQYQLYHAAQP